MRPELILLMCGWLVVAPPGPKKAKSVKTPRGDDVVVDLVQQRGGPKLLGAVLNRDAQGNLAVAVERSWLRQSAPAFLGEHEEREVAEARIAWRELKDRLRAWREQRSTDRRLVGYIDDELRRAAEGTVRLTPEGARLDSQFVLIDVPARQVERMQAPPAERRQLALVAWREQLEDVVGRSAHSLEQELADRGIRPAAERVNLADRLPIRRQTSRQWMARQAVIEFVEREPLEFQGTGELLVRTSAGGAPPAWGGLINQILQSQISSTLDELLNDSPRGKRQTATISSKALERACREAGEAEINGFRTTVLSLAVEGRKATVDSRFQARLDDGRWQAIWGRAESQAAGAGDDDRRTQIRNDPQVKSALELLKSTGLANEEVVETAIGVGAATMAAQERVGHEFRQFLGLYARHADGPPIFLPEPAPGDLAPAGTSRGGSR